MWSLARWLECKIPVVMYVARTTRGGKLESSGRWDESSSKAERTCMCAALKSLSKCLALCSHTCLPHAYSHYIRGSLAVQLPIKPSGPLEEMCCFHLSLCSLPLVSPDEFTCMLNEIISTKTGTVSSPQQAKVLVFAGFSHSGHGDQKITLCILLRIVDKRAERSTKPRKERSRRLLAAR